MNAYRFATAIGICGIAWEGERVTRFWLPDAPGSTGGESLDEPPAWIAALVSRVRAHLAGQYDAFEDVPLAWDLVSEFQQAVYRQTVAIKPGHKNSYGAIARALGHGPEAARAVGVALGANPWPLLVPCHRVVSASDRMTGFSAPGGIRTKTRLLALEGAELLSE